MYLNYSKNQKLSSDYIKDNKIDYLFSEMLYNTVQSKSEEPLVYMVFILIINRSNIYRN